MISFGLTEDQLEYQRMAPIHRADGDPPCRALDETGHFPKDAIRSAWENGLLNLCIPSSVGAQVCRWWTR